MLFPQKQNNAKTANTTKEHEGTWEDGGCVCDPDYGDGILEYAHIQAHQKVYIKHLCISIIPL